MLVSKFFDSILDICFLDVFNFLRALLPNSFLQIISLLLSQKRRVGFSWYLWFSDYDLRIISFIKIRKRFDFFFRFISMSSMNILKLFWESKIFIILLFDLLAEFGFWLFWSFWIIWFYRIVISCFISSLISFISFPAS